MRQFLRIILGLLVIATLWGGIGLVVLLIGLGSALNGNQLIGTILSGVWVLAGLAMAVGYVWRVNRQAADEAGRMTGEAVRLRRNLRKGNAPE